MSATPAGRVAKPAPEPQADAESSPAPGPQAFAESSEQELADVAATYLMKTAASRASTAVADPNIVHPKGGGEAPAEIKVAKAPGKDKPMEVVVAAEVLRRVKRTRQAVSLVSRVIIRSYEEEALHAEVCRHLVNHGGYLMAWIGLAEEEPERIIRPVAHDGIEPNFLGALSITWANDLITLSPTSLAMKEQRPQVARNILQEPRFAVLREEAQLFGYTATCALPLQFAQYGFGVLTIHAMEPDAFNAEEVSLLRELANDLSVGVVNLRDLGRRRALEKRLATVVDAADNAIIGRDLDGIITEWNQGATRMFGYERDEAIGKPLNGLLVPPDRRDEEREVRLAVAAGERPPRYDTARFTKDGKLIQTAVTVTPILAGDGKVLGVTAIEHDITKERLLDSAKRARGLEDAEVRRLKEMDQMRKTFLSEASHELKTPLTPLVIHVEALREAPDMGPEDISRHVEVIHRNVTRLRRLVDDMLDSSRLETGRFVLDESEFPIALALRDVVDALAEPAVANGITLEVGDLAALPVRADRARIDQVLHNLVGNAISFTPQGGRVTVSAGLEDGQAVVRVIDTGVGLTSDQLAQLFQPFARPHEGTGTAPKGTGLGLFIAKGILEQQGGRIWAESPGPGQGASFCFALPVAADPSEAADPPEPA